MSREVYSVSLASQVFLMTVYFYFSMKMNGNANGELTLDTIESCVWILMKMQG